MISLTKPSEQEFVSKKEADVFYAANKDKVTFGLIMTRAANNINLVRVRKI